MADSFDFELTGDVEEAVERAKDSAKKAGSTFHGDRFAGMFRGKGVEGYYRVEGSKVLVTVSEKPAMIPLSIIEMSIRTYFGVDSVAPPPVQPQIDDDEDRRRQLRPRAKDLVQKHSLFASGAGLVPVPLADIAAVTAVQVNMLYELTALYNVTYSRDALTQFATALTGSTLARLGASAVKLIPGIGTLLGGATMSIMSGASTYAIGAVTIGELEAGRKIGSTATDGLKRAYKEAFEEGKALIARLKRSPGDGKRK